MIIILIMIEQFCFCLENKDMHIAQGLSGHVHLKKILIKL